MSKANDSTNMNNAKKVNNSVIQRLVLIAVLILLYGFFYIVSPSFRNYTTLAWIFNNMYYTLLIAIGVTFPLITGGNDLSIGTGLICYSLIGSYLMRICGWPLWAAIIITILMGVVMGAVNGFGVAKLNIPPFIMTLGTMMFCRGMGSIVTGGFSGTWPNYMEEGAGFRKVFRVIATSETGERTPIPLGLVWMVIVVIVMTLVLNRTRTGRYIISIGSNKEALKLSGVNVVKWHIIAYMICGLFTGLAAVTYAATFSNITPGQGAGFELNAIGAAIIGGTAMTGGAGSIFGTFLGVLLISLLQVGLPFIGLNADWQLLITGIILIVAVAVDRMKNKKSRIA